MVLRKPRSCFKPSNAFIPAQSLPALHRHPLQRAQCERRVVICRATKLLVIDLPAFLEQSVAKDLKTFSERVSVDRTQAKDSTFVVYTTPEAYTRAMMDVRKTGLIEPDALVTFDGSELYQRGYRSADPLWAKTVGQEWDAKPAAWVVDKFFGDELEWSAEEELEMVFVRKGEKQVGEELEGKLKEMGVRARVKEEGDRIVLVPMGGGVGKVIEFCQMMLGISKQETFVWGKAVDECIDSGCCELKGEGAKGVLEGILHHAVF